MFNALNSWIQRILNKPRTSPESPSLGGGSLSRVGRTSLLFNASGHDKTAVAVCICTGCPAHPPTHPSICPCPRMCPAAHILHVHLPTPLLLPTGCPSTLNPVSRFPSCLITSILSPHHPKRVRGKPPTDTPAAVLQASVMHYQPQLRSRKWTQTTQSSHIPVY